MCPVPAGLATSGLLFFTAMKTLEHDEQVNLMKWWSLSCRSFGVDERLLFAIPNGGERNVIVAARLKAEGVRAGVPDLFLAHPNNEYHGLFIEMKKAKGGIVSDNQKCYLDLLKANGYRAEVCHGWIQAKQIIEDYLK
jgi:hypothetical protein